MNSGNMDQGAVGGGGQPTGNMGNMGTTNAGNANGSEDYMDKGLDAVEKRFGGGKVDPVKQRGMNEKITDGARGMFEKFTGKKLPSKFSN